VSYFHLVGRRDHRTQFWKGAIQGPFHQSLVAIGPVVSHKKIKIQIKQNLTGMVPWSVPFKIVSDSHALHPRWPLLIKIEISSNGQNCSIYFTEKPGIYAKLLLAM
jgi:hypothetical protein